MPGIDISLTSAARRSRQGGFTLLEVMVAMFIFAGGLLGLSVLQMSSLNYSHSAYLRTQATIAIYDMVDRMRVNRDVLATNAYDSVDTDATTPSDPNCITSGCTAAQLAAYDIREWSRLFKNVDNESDYVAILPAASGTVTRVSGTLFTVTVNWQENGAVSKQQSMNIRIVD